MLQSNGIGRYLSLSDENFLDLVETDIKEFIQKFNKNHNSVLIFPPVNNLRRYIIHKTCENIGGESNDIATFSLGEGLRRCTVVCFEDQVIDKTVLGKNSTNNNASYSSSKTSKYKQQQKSWRSLDIDEDRCDEMGLDNGRNTSRDYSTQNHKVETKNTKKVEDYRLLADTDTTERRKSVSTITGNEFRKPELNSDEESVSHCTTTNNPLIVPPKRQRRPDRAVYVPKGRRSLEPPLTTNNTTTTTTISNTDSELLEIKNNKSQKQFDNSTENPIPSSVIANTVDETTSDSSSEFILCNNQSVNQALPSSIQPIIMKTEPVKLENTNKKVAAKSKTSHENNKEKCQKENHKMKLDETNKDELFTQSVTLRNDNSVIVPHSVRPKITKQSSKDKMTKTSENISAKGSLQHHNHSNEIANNHSTIQSGASGDGGDEETDDWDALYDDNGECLDPKFMNDLTTAVGKVSIEKPKSDYSVYETKVNLLNNEEFPHVLEISNFPVEFKTQDLMMIFSPYKESGFDIKWVDDTHALVVFSNARIAAEVLSMSHPFVHFKPLAKASPESRNKAKKCSSVLQPYRARPETCAALARRLVSGALGVKIKTSREELENEKKILKEAKARKLLAAKQREEMWEGTT